MHKNLVSGLCTVMFAVCCVSSFSVAAVDVPEISVISSDALSHIIDYYDISGQLINSDTVFYCVGHNRSNSSNICALLAIGSTLYRVSFDYSSVSPSYSFYSGGYSFSVNSSGVGQRMVAFFYYDSSISSSVSPTYDLDLFYTNSSTDYDSFQSYVINYNINIASYYFGTNSDCTVDQFYTDFSDVVTPVSVTESSSSSVDGLSAGDLLYGGHTLETGEPSTYPSDFSPDDAADFFDSIDTDLDSSVADAVGFFWALSSKFFDSLDIWFYVFFAMLFAFICWLFGR